MSTENQATTTDGRGRFAGQVAFITGVARGQGRSHALALARDGADIIGVDICAPVGGMPYEMATPADLDETQALIEQLGRRASLHVADVRSPTAVGAALDAGVEALGGVDIVIANAGVAAYAPAHEISEEQWSATIDINLSGVWRTCKAAMPHLIEQRRGSIVIVSSGAGLRSGPNLAHYAASKHGTIGLMRTLAAELAPFSVRVNAVCPTQVDTPMIMNDPLFQLFRPDLEAPTREDIIEPSKAINALPIPWVEPEDVSHVIGFLCSDEARYITGVAMPVDAGATL